MPHSACLFRVHGTADRAQFVTHRDKLGAASIVSQEWHRAARSVVAWRAVRVYRSELEGPFGDFLLHHRACRRLQSLEIVDDGLPDWNPDGTAQHRQWTDGVRKWVLQAPYRVHLQRVAIPWPPSTLRDAVDRLPSLRELGLCAGTAVHHRELRDTLPRLHRLRALHIDPRCNLYTLYLPLADVAEHCPALQSFGGDLYESAAPPAWLHPSLPVLPLRRLTCNHARGQNDIRRVANVVRRHRVAELTVDFGGVNLLHPNYAPCLASVRWMRVGVVHTTALQMAILPGGLEALHLRCYWQDRMAAALTDALRSGPVPPRLSSVHIHSPPHDLDPARVWSTLRCEAGQWAAWTPSLRHVDVTVCETRHEDPLACEQRCRCHTAEERIRLDDGNTLTVALHWHRVQPWRLPLRLVCLAWLLLLAVGGYAATAGIRWWKWGLRKTQDALAAFVSRNASA